MRGYSGSAEAGDMREGQELRQDLLPGGRLELIGREGHVDVKADRLRAAESIEMGSASEVMADVVRVGADVEPLAADHPEVDLGQPCSEDLVGVDVNETGLALDRLALTVQLVEGYAVLLDSSETIGGVW